MKVIILGTAGTGKTYLLKQILLQSIKKNRFIFIYDFLNGFSYPSTQRVLIFRDVDVKYFYFLPEIIQSDIFIDEMDFYLMNSKIKPLLQKVFIIARNRGLNIYATCKRFFNIGRIYTYLADYIYLFRIIEPLDLKFFSKEYGIDNERLRKLKNYHCFEIKTDTLSIKETTNTKANVIFSNTI